MNNTPLWAKNSDVVIPDEVKAVNNSLPFDYVLLPYDLKASIAHVRMLKSCNILTRETSDRIINTLNDMVKEGDELLNKILSSGEEDVHSAIEAELIKRIGEDGKKVHTARSRNDQVATAFRLLVADYIASISDKVALFIKALSDTAYKHTETVMPGYTHLQHAQCVSLGYYLTTYAYMFYADYKALKKAEKSCMEYLPLGSLAFAGTSFKTDRNMMAKELGFNAPSPTASYGVSDRDFLLETLHCLSVLALHLSRISEEFILWSSNEFGFINMDKRYSTGSSIMPQKKNPDIPELIRGKSARVFSAYSRVWIALKALPLSYNKDMQEDKEAFFDAFETTTIMLDAIIPFFSTLTFNIKRMEEESKKGYMNATDAADYLVKKGVPFRTAYRIVGTLVENISKSGVALEDLSLSEYKKASPLFDEDIVEFVKEINCMQRRSSYGGCASLEVKARLDDLLNALRDSKVFLRDTLTKS